MKTIKIVSIMALLLHAYSCFTSQNGLVQNIVNQPIFATFKELHTQFKKDKEALGNQLSAGTMTKQQFDDSFEQLRKEFDAAKENFRAKNSYIQMHSFLEGQHLITRLRALQQQEEQPLKETHLLTPETYNRPLFEKERKKIERQHEAIRAFVGLFTQTAQTDEEQALTTNLQDMQRLHKESWYQLKNELLPTGATYAQELAFQDAEKSLLQQHAQTYNAILTKASSLAFPAHKEQSAMFAVTEEDAKCIPTLKPSSHASYVAPIDLRRIAAKL